VDAAPPFERANEDIAVLAVRPADGVVTRFTVSEKSPIAFRLSVEVPVDPGVIDVAVSLNAVDVAVETV
jgi:hypothetical protein